NVKVPILLEAPRRVGESRSTDDGARATDAELARQQVRAEEGKGVGEQEQQVVPDDGGARSVADHPRGRIADQRVREGEAVSQRPEGVRLEVVEWLVKDRVAAPGDLPCLHQGVSDVARHVASEV